MYDDIYLRNKGYVSEDLQKKIRNTRVLIAGCGIGSTIAEAAMRLGFYQMTLADGDTIEVHNLNRQAFGYSDVGKSKVSALAKRLRDINPEAKIIEHDDWITEDNVKTLVNGCDLVFDTVDFLDIKAITDLHDEANAQSKPIISAVSAGWGAAGIYFPPTGQEGSLFRVLFGLPEQGNVVNESYVQHFSAFIERIAEYLDPSVAQAMAKALTVMEDGTPCPAPHVAAGSFSVAALAVTMAARLLNNDDLAQAPQLILANMGAIAAEGNINLAG